MVDVRLIRPTFLHLAKASLDGRKCAFIYVSMDSVPNSLQSRLLGSRSRIVSTGLLSHRSMHQISTSRPPVLMTGEAMTLVDERNRINELQKDVNIGQTYGRAVWLAAENAQIASQLAPRGYRLSRCGHVAGRRTSNVMFFASLKATAIGVSTARLIVKLTILGDWMLCPE